MTQNEKTSRESANSKQQGESQIWDSVGRLADEVSSLTSEFRTHLAKPKPKLIIAVVGYFVNLTVQERERVTQLALKDRELQSQKAIQERAIQGRLSELAIGILQNKPTDDGKEIRIWARDVIDTYSGVPLPEQVLTTPFPSLVVIKAFDALIEARAAHKVFEDYEILLITLGLSDDDRQAIKAGDITPEIRSRLAAACRKELGENASPEKVEKVIKNIQSK